MRGSLVWAGLPDPDTRENLTEQADDERDELRAMEGWAELGGPRTVADACNSVESAIDGKYSILRTVIAGLPQHLSKQKGLGDMLRSYRGRVLDGRRFERTDHKIPKWYLAEVKYGAVS